MQRKKKKKRSTVFSKTCKQKNNRGISINSQHRLHVIRNIERSFRLGLDLVNGDTISKLNQGQALGEVDVENAELSDDTANAGRTGQGELALLDNLRVALLVGVLHGHDDLGGRWVGDEVHGTAEALDFTGEHP